MNLIENLKYLRKKNNMKQSDFGNLIGVSGAAISEYEKGRSKPSFDSVVILAEYFDVSIDDLFKVNMAAEASGYVPPAPLTQSDISPDFDPQKYIVKSVVRNEAKVEVLWRLVMERERQSGKSAEQIRAETDRLFREAMERTREDMTGEE